MTGWCENPTITPLIHYDKSSGLKYRSGRVLMRNGAQKQRERKQESSEKPPLRGSQ